MTTQLAGRSRSGTPQSHTTLRAGSSSGGTSFPAVVIKRKASRSESRKRGSIRSLASSKHVSFVTCQGESFHKTKRRHRSREINFVQNRFHFSCSLGRFFFSGDEECL